MPGQFLVLNPVVKPFINCFWEGLKLLALARGKANQGYYVSEQLLWSCTLYFGPLQLLISLPDQFGCEAVRRFFLWHPTIA